MGPVPVARLKSLYQEGALDDTTPIWNRSMSQWTAMQNVPAVWNLVNGLSVESVSSRLYIARMHDHSTYIRASSSTPSGHHAAKERADVHRAFGGGEEGRSGTVQNGDGLQTTGYDPSYSALCPFSDSKLPHSLCTYSVVTEPKGMDPADEKEDGECSLCPFLHSL